MEYWIIIDNKHAGPYSATQLIDAGLTPETLVWHEGLADWAKAGEVPELAAEMQRSQLMDAEARPESDVEAAEDDATVEAYNEAYAAPQQASTVTDCHCRHQAAYTQPYEAPPQAIAQQCTEPCPPAYIAWSVIVTVLCCTIIGIPAIIFSSMTKKRILPWGPSKGQTLFRTGPMVHNHVNRMRSGRHTVPGHIHGITLMNGNKRIIMAAGALMLTAAMIFLYLRITSALGWMPLCPVHALTGLSCPGCGSQRALASLLEGHIAEAVSHNYILPAALAYLSLCGMHWIFPANNTISKIYRRITTPRALIAVALAMLAWMAVRNIAGC